MIFWLNASSFKSRTATLAPSFRNLLNMIIKNTCKFLKVPFFYFLEVNQLYNLECPSVSSIKRETWFSWLLFTILLDSHVKFMYPLRICTLQLVMSVCVMFTIPLLFFLWMMPSLFVINLSYSYKVLQKPLSDSNQIYLRWY